MLTAALPLQTYRYKAGSRGVDMIPQNRFWAALPGLVFDGVQYTRGLTGSEGGATPVAADAAQTTGLSDEVPDYGAHDRLQTTLAGLRFHSRRSRCVSGAADDGESSSSSKRGRKKGKREKQSPADSDRSSSKGSRGGRSSKGSKGKEKKARKKSRPRNDLDEPVTAHHNHHHQPLCTGNFGPRAAVLTTSACAGRGGGGAAGGRGRGGVRHAAAGGAHGRCGRRGAQQSGQGQGLLTARVTYKIVYSNAARVGGEH
eukprot:COSAG04_NODE_393_length_15147_cov_44.965643_4_plen_257_part_00